MIEFLGTLVPLWAALLLILLAGLAGWFWGRAAVADVRLRAEAAEREARFQASRAAVHQPAAEALTRVLTGPRSIRPGDDLDRFIAETAAQDAAALSGDFRRAAADFPALAPGDWDTAHDVYPSDDDEPEEPDGDRDGPPPSGEPVSAYRAAILPRYDWAGQTGWDPLTGSMPPPARSAPQGLPWGRGLDLLRRAAVLPLAPVRLARWTLAGWFWRAEARVEAREEAEAAQLLGFDPEPAGETQVIPVVASVPAPRNVNYQPRHDFAEVPPSLRRLAEVLPVTVRCTVIARAVNPRWMPRPATRVGLELWAAKVARRHGIPMLLGQCRLAGTLP